MYTWRWAITFPKPWPAACTKHHKLLLNDITTFRNNTNNWRIQLLIVKSNINRGNNVISGAIAIKTNLPWINRNSSSISLAIQNIYKACRASSPYATRPAGAPLLPMFPVTETCPWLRSLARGGNVHPS